MGSSSLLLFWGYCHLFFWVVFPLESMAVDVNECLDTTTCPAYATCTNTLDSYYCTCKRGFLSSNGLTQFRGPGVTCKDIDECSQSSSKCGPHSVCRNLLGRYKCSCFPGFSSPTGNDWIPGYPGHFSCTDVDECADPGICPEHATCHNSPGSYSCVCNLGFESSSGNRNIQGPGETCEDVDECARNSTLCGLDSICINTLGKYNCSCLPGFFSPAVWTPETVEDFRCVDVDECLHMCPSNATCTNTPGSYFCTCSPGFAPSNGKLSFTEQGVHCRDIDECSQGPSPCGPNSVCTNALGSYSCSCIGGFQPNPEGSLNFSCKRIPFKCKEDVIPNNEQVQLCQVGAAVEPEHGSFCTLMNATFSVLDDACENRTAEVSLKNTAESLSSVLKQTSTWSNFTKEETSALATVVLESVKSSTLAAFLNPSANVSQTVRAEHLGTRARFPPGAGLERGPGRCDSSPLSHIPFPQWFQTSEVTEEPVQGYEQHLPFTEWLTLS